MPKIRGIKPETWTDENFVELSAFARLLWIGLWNHACDNGHLQDKSKQIKMRVLPTDDVNCAELLREIEGQGLIARADGWITIPNLSHHQKPHKRWFVVCEKPGCKHPEGTSYGFSKPETTVEQLLVNDEPPPDNGGSTADGDGDVEGDVDLMVINEAADKSATTPGQSLATIEREDITRLCDHLADRIAEDGSKRPAIGKTWLDAARLMLDKDGRTEHEIHAAIDWCQSHHFWRTNVLSMPKLREKFDQLRKVALSEQQTRPGSGSRNEEWKSMQERQMARAIEREREMGLR